MGLIKELVLLPVAPLRFTVWVAEQVAEEADRQQSSPASAVQQLDELEEAKRKGEVDEEKAEELEGQILEGQLTKAKEMAEEEGAQGG